MHTDVDYSQFKDEDEKRSQALKDIKEWLGPQKYVELCSLFKEQDKRNRFNFDRFSNYLEIGGIRGYPVTVMYETIFNRPVNE